MGFFLNGLVDTKSEQDLHVFWHNNNTRFSYSNKAVLLGLFRSLFTGFKGSEKATYMCWNHSLKQPLGNLNSVVIHYF